MTTQTTPLLLLSEYVEQTNLNNGTLTGLDTVSLSRLRRGIIKASEFVQRIYRRRFDEWYEVRDHTALDARVGGHLLSPWDLMLDADLREAISVKNGEGTTISSSGYKLVDPDTGVGGVRAYRQIHLNPYGSVLWYSGGNDPINAIPIEGRWGYGGIWVSSGTTISGTVQQGVADTQLTVVNGAVLEVGMVLRLRIVSGSTTTIEYEYVDSFASASVLNVTRAYNGSIAQTWAISTAIDYWQPLDSVRDIVSRLIQWRSEQVKAPLAGQVTIGEMTFPVNTDGLPKDLFILMKEAALGRSESGWGV